jgi:hypothetical protein
VSIPQWEAEAGRAFLVRGERIVRVLVKAAGAAEQENRRKTPHGGSVPPRATTPGSNGNSGSAKTGVVTPATRPGSAGAGARKRQRVGEASSGEERARVPLGVHRGQAASLTYASPVKVGSSSLPRPVAVSVGRGGVEFRGLYGVLGYGRAPGGVEAGAGREVRGTLSVSVSTGGVGAGRTASRARRESFRPRMSADGSEVGVGVGVGVGGRWGGFGGGAVREEDEGY